MKTYRTLTWLILLLIVANVLVACSTSATNAPTASLPSIPKVTLIARDLSLTMPATLPAGYVDITMVNEGMQTQPAQFARLQQTATLEQLQALVQKDRDAILPLITPMGGMLAVAAGQSQHIVLDLLPCQYIVLNFIAEDHTLPQSSKTLITPFTVTAPSNTQQPHPPRSDLKVTLKDYSFDVPEAIKSGPLMYQVTNLGPQAHEMVFVKLEQGKSWKDVMAFLQSPQSTSLPGSVVGGVSTLSPSETLWTTMDLAPGTYVVLCFLPERASAYLHVQLGMICSITVQ
jgi:hypothetical protein